MFERAHHRRIATVLEALDARLLASNHCLFGGGTAITLRHGEYRESIDVDFLVSDIHGYRALRQRLSSNKGIREIMRPGTALQQTRDIRADQYGIRTMLRVHDTELKFEIVLEGRITLEPAAPSDRICGVATLSTLDMATSKLLANSDRWADDSVNSRDLIDLAMIAPDKTTLRLAIDKASDAYGVSIERDLTKAIDALQRRRGRLADCMAALQMTAVPPGIAPVPAAVLWRQIRRLRPKATARAAAKKNR